MSFREVLDQSVEPEASELIAHATLREVLLRLAQQLGQMRAELTVGKTGEQQIVQRKSGAAKCAA